MRDSSPSADARPPDDPLAGTETIAVGAADVAVAIVTFAASAGVLWAALGGGLAVRWALLLHCGTVCIPAGFFALRQRHRGELTIPALLVLATFAGGPMGAAAVACATLALAWRRPRPQRLRDWYAYIMGVVEHGPGERLYQELTAGRAPADPMAAPTAFMPILRGNSIDDQQRVLGVVGRRFHGDFRSVLREALRNRDGFVRAQAAAIASRLDLHEKSLLWSQDAAPGATPSDGARAIPRQLQDAG